MGRWSYSGRQEADSLKKVEIYWLKKYGYLQGWKSGGIEWTSGWSDSKSSISIEVSIIGDLRKYYAGEQSGEEYIRFQYTQTDRNGEKKDFDYKVPLTTTPCNFGGLRYWFICPLSVNGNYCGRRVGVLYKGGDYFGCRHCYNLTYESRNLSGISKVAGKVISIPELERLEKETKRRIYAGKMTRKYKNYLKKENKSHYQLRAMVIGLNAKSLILKQAHLR